MIIVVDWSICEGLNWMKMDIYSVKGLEFFEKLGKIWEILRKLREYWKFLENIAKPKGKVGKIFYIWENIPIFEEISNWTFQILANVANKQIKKIWKI
jgi:hypothetical protein